MKKNIIKSKELPAIEKLNNNCCASVGISVGKMDCKPSDYRATKVKFNAVTKECFDERGNFIGFGIYNESTQTLIVSAQH